MATTSYVFSVLASVLFFYLLAFETTSHRTDTTTAIAANPAGLGLPGKRLDRGVVAVEERLTREVAERLRAAKYRFDSVFVNVVSAKYNRTECLIEGLQKEVSSNLFEAVVGSLEVRHMGNGLWSFVGQGGLGQMKFHVDASAEMGQPQTDPPETAFRYAEPDGNEAATSVVARASTFGPVIERVVNDLDDEQGNEALDFKTGQLLSLPADVGRWPRPARLDWMTTNAVDLLVDFAREQWALLGQGLKFGDLTDERWESASPAELATALTSGTRRLETRTNRSGAFYLLPTNVLPPMTFVFLTATGDRGVLQITGYTEKPRGVKLRYKLEQAAPPITSAKPGE